MATRTRAGRAPAREHSLAIQMMKRKHEGDIDPVRQGDAPAPFGDAAAGCTPSTSTTGSDAAAKPASAAAAADGGAPPALFSFGGVAVAPASGGEGAAAAAKPAPALAPGGAAKLGPTGDDWRKRLAAADGAAKLAPTSRTGGGAAPSPLAFGGAAAAATPNANANANGQGAAFTFGGSAGGASFAFGAAPAAAPPVTFERGPVTSNANAAPNANGPGAAAAAFTFGAAAAQQPAGAFGFGGNPQPFNPGAFNFGAAAAPFACTFGPAAAAEQDPHEDTLNVIEELRSSDAAVRLRAAQLLRRCFDCQLSQLFKPAAVFNPGNEVGPEMLSALAKVSGEYRPAAVEAKALSVVGVYAALCDAVCLGGSPKARLKLALTPSAREAPTAAALGALHVASTCPKRAEREAGLSEIARGWACRCCARCSARPSRLSRSPVGPGDPKAGMPNTT